MTVNAGRPPSTDSTNAGNATSATGSSPEPERIHVLLSHIPTGQVVSYGQLAALAGYPGRARWVGRVLSRLPADSTLPWHRVLNAGGLLRGPHAAEASKRLMAEGIKVDAGRVSMARYRWQPA